MGEEATADHATEMDTARRRERALIEFPYADLARSADLTKTLGETGGKVWIDQSQLAVGLDMSVSGGTFRGRLSAAKMFGFIETGSGKVRLSDLGIRLLDESTTRSAKAEAFLNVPLYRAMYDSYNGFALPPAAAIERQMASLGVPQKQTDRARQVFSTSAQAAGYIASNGRFSKPMISPAEAKDDESSQDTGGRGGGGGAGNGGANAGVEPPRRDAPRYDPPPVTEKALEYKLVDLMSEALDKPDVMEAIIKVVTFLKGREALQRNTGTDQK